ncbi:hypothetical protein D3C74_414960 [compost metagenome]
MAIYNVKHKKYIVTNDVVENGLNGSANSIEILGQANSLDGIMFIIWEHQVCNGVEYTILDEINKQKTEQSVKVNNSEWMWDKNDVRYINFSAFPW